MDNEQTNSRYQITTHPIVPEVILQKVIRPEAGAAVLFVGTVREFTKGRRTLHLEYEAYQTLAIKQLQRIGEEVSRRWEDTTTAITHRIGWLEISEAAVVIAVSSPHRKAAYEANEYAIERIKEIVPIWKKEFWEDGSQWIGDQRETFEYPMGFPSEKDE